MRNSVNKIKDRREEIINLLYSDENNSKTVQFLSDYFNVSEMTIRRDLKYLEDIDLATRFHGGVRLNNNKVTKDTDNSLYIERIKMEIARKASEYIDDHSTVYLNSGTTALNIVDYLEELSLVLISNNVHLHEKQTNPNITTILTGGELRQPRDVLVGDLAANAISAMHADFAILSCSGISAEKGISTNNIHEARINKLMINNTNQFVIVVADHRKIGHDTNFVVTSLDNVDIVITDIYSDTKAIRKMEELGVTVVQVEV